MIYKFLHRFEQIFNRIVPTWIFRFSVGDVFELDIPQLAELSKKLDLQGMSIKSVEDAEERSDLRKNTWNSTLLSCTENDFGYSVVDEPSKEFLGGVWVGEDYFIESDLGFEIRMRPKQAWLYCAFVSKAARGRGIYQRLLGFVGQHVADKGFEQLYVMVQPWNKASTYIHKKYSSRSIGRIIVIRIFSLSVLFRTGLLTKDRTITTQLIRNPVQVKLP
jgi:GNAT superfamily N-acetyltransferase